MVVKEVRTDIDPSVVFCVSQCREEGYDYCCNYENSGHGGVREAGCVHIGE